MIIYHIVILFIAKCIAFACRLAGKQGVTLAGLFVLKADPGLPKHLASQIRKETVVVCGTNGKTTTNNLLALALKSNQLKVLCNSTGSNMLNGIIACLVLNSNWYGKLDYDYACFEIDEASTLKVFPYLTVNTMILTNLFRDQLDRYGEIDTTMALLEKALALQPDIHVIFNSDDIVSTTLVLDSKHDYTTFGIDYPLLNQDNNDMKEGQFCPRCNHHIKYHYLHYAQLGDFYCPHCGYSHLPINTTLHNIDYHDTLSFECDGVQFHSNLKGFYNCYNLLAVLTYLKSQKLSLQSFADALLSYQGAFGRLEQFTINGVHVLLNLAKNPAGFNQNIDLVLNDSSDKEVIIAINDNEQDGIDVSWLWDVDFDRLKDPNINTYYTTGTRYMDMALRLKYVDIPCTPVASLSECIDTAITNSKSKNLYVLVNYTCLYTASQYLKSKEKKS